MVMAGDPPNPYMNKSKLAMAIIIKRKELPKSPNMAIIVSGKMMPPETIGPSNFLVPRLKLLTWSRGV